MKTLLYIGNKLSQKNKTLTTIETLGKGLEELGYTLIYASSKQNKVLRLWDMICVLITQFRKVDYVLIDTYSTSNFYYALIISQLCRVFKLNYIPILHGGNLPERLNSNPKLSELIFNNAYNNVAPSNYTKNAFELMGFFNIEVIPNSINIDNYPVVSKNYKDIQLLWVRSFSKLYHPELAVHVLNELKGLGYNASLCMVGPDNDGSLERTKLLAQTLNLDIKFTGKLEKSEWINLSKDYNYFINTTNFDNLPVSVIEAMALGFPIISTDVGGLPYLMTSEKNGLLVSSNDVKVFTQAILRLHHNTDLRYKIILEAIKTSKEYDWKIVKYKWKALLT